MNQIEYEYKKMIYRLLNEDENEVNNQDIMMPNEPSESGNTDNDDTDAASSTATPNTTPNANFDVNKFTDKYIKKNNYSDVIDILKQYGGGTFEAPSQDGCFSGTDVRILNQKQAGLDGVTANMTNAVNTAKGIVK